MILLDVIMYLAPNEVNVLETQTSIEKTLITVKYDGSSRSVKLLSLPGGG